MPKDLHSLPKLRDSLTYIYLEKAVIEQDAMSIVSIQGTHRTPIPIAAMTVLLLGPGTSITQAAIKTISDCGCMVEWCGDRAQKFYAFGSGETRSAENLLKQAELCMDQEKHMQVVYRMYQRRFPDIKTEGMTLQQVRGLEGIRVREAYKQAAKEAGIKWTKRDYKTTDWNDSDPVNQALSHANTILYALCQSAIISLGYSTGLGFIHTGKLLSFVYDIADLYKATTTVPAAFQAAAYPGDDLLAQVRLKCRQYLHAQKVLKRIPEDIAWIFDISGDTEETSAEAVGDLWDKDGGTIEGGKNYAGGD